MFYSHDLLCRRKNGKFSIVWLAATSKKKINRPSCLKVNIIQTCEEISKIITTQHSADGQCGQPRVKFSLYLSSLLMHGTCIVFKQQVDIFLTDLIIVQQGLTQVHLSDDGYLVHVAVKERHPRDEDDDSEDGEETGKSRPKKARKPREAKVVVLPVVDMEEQIPLPAPILPLQSSPQLEGGHALHLLNDADSRIPALDVEFYHPLPVGQEGIMDIDALDKMGALFDQMNTSMMAQKSIQEAEHVATIHEPVIEEVVQEQPMEVEVPTTTGPPCETTDLFNEQREAASIAPMETDALLMADLAGTEAQTDQLLAALVAPEEIIAPKMEEEPAALTKEPEPIPQPIPMVMDPVPEPEPQPPQPTTAEPPTSRKGKRKAVMPEQIPEKRKRCWRFFADRTTSIDLDSIKRQIYEPSIYQKTMRVMSFYEDIPEYVNLNTRIHSEELLGIHSINIINNIKNLFEYRVQIQNQSSHASNTSTVDKSRAGSETSKISFDRSRLSQHLSHMAEETSRIQTSALIPEEDLNIAQINVEDVPLQQLEITREIDLPAVLLEAAEAELLQMPEVMPGLPNVLPDIVEEDLHRGPAVVPTVQPETDGEYLARDPEVVPTVQPETDGEYLARDPEVVPTAQLDDVVGEPNHLALQQDYVELPIEEQFPLQEFLVPSMPLDKDTHNKRERANASIDSTIDSNTSASTPQSQKEQNLVMSLEYHWSHSDKVVTFRAICHPTKATKKQAARMFSLLLEMKKYRKIDLKQRNPMKFGTIEIHPLTFSSSCSAATTPAS